MWPFLNNLFHLLGFGGVFSQESFQLRFFSSSIVSFHRENDLFARMVELNHLQRQFISFIKRICGLGNLGFSQMQGRDKSFHLLSQIHYYSPVEKAEDLPRCFIAHRVLSGQLGPRVRLKLFVAQGDAAVFPIDIQHPHLNLFSFFHYLCRMLDSLSPG